ncbi:hypothetical protein VN97_g12706 [Penicillium thymicola]|uniref:PNPLA domain-containing protein n=1 Tax=Penicillium thymicola TaxID=293382 RepID=A0AAI9T4Y5_PENTH|nr:hypothetical protein VN97_g12706 [Penicillium thymicola]
MEQESTIKHGEPNPVDFTGLCLLSLDGGGVRGLSSLYILKSIMDRLNHVRGQNKLPRVKPCEVFDLIGGTSTGGLIAIMLGRLEMDVDECIDAYSDLAAAVFGEKLRSIPFNLFKGDITARFDLAKLESAIRKVVEDSGASMQDLFNDGTERGCRTFVCTADRHTKDIVRLRSYSLPHEPNILATTCQAALATSAATTFFEPVSIGDRSFADGGLGANNPVDEVEGEASNIWCPETGDLKPLVKCFISIGTGNPGKKPFEGSILKFLGQTVVQIATETENTERRFIARWARHFDEKRYFRFNVEQGLQEIGLEEYKKKGAMEAATEGYLTHMAQKFRVRDCIQNMRLKQIPLMQKEDFSFRGPVGIYLGQAPYIASELFVGRGHELDEIAKALHPKDKAQRQQRLVLGGMGGIGKTQLAIAYAESGRGSYSSVFWLNAVSEAALKDSFRSIASHIFDVQEPGVLEDKEIVRRVHQWLSTPKNTGWLLIFDNYDDPDQFRMNDYYPPASHGAIVVTTRRADLIAGSTLDIKPLENIEDSLAILQTRSKRENVQSDPHAKRLAERLAGLPLALATAGTYLQRNTFTFERYLQEYEKRWNISPRRPLQLQEYQERTLYTTWDLSCSRLEKEDPDAAKILKLLAYFDNQRLWYELFHTGLTESSPEWLREVITDDVNFNEVMGVLTGYYFLDVHQTSDSWSMHNCVHDWTLAALNKDIDATYYWYAFDCVSTAINDDNEDGFAKVSYSALAAHATRLVQQRLCQNDVIYDIAPPRLDQASLIANLLRDQLLFLAGEQMYQRALAGYEKALGPDHTSTLNTIHNLGVLYRDQGKLGQAEQMYQRALAGSEKALGPDYALTLSTVNNLGILYRVQGKLDQAEQMYQRALAGSEKALGPDYALTLDTVNNLGILYRVQGKLDQAEQMYQRALAGSEKALGPDYALTLSTVNNLGILYRDQGKLDQAEQMHQRKGLGKVKRNTATCFFK